MTTMTKQKAVAKPPSPNAKAIIFSGDMVREILVGRKTQARRVVRLPKGKGLEYRWDDARKDGGPKSPFKAGEYLHIQFRAVVDEWMGQTDRVFCPYGVPGDQLWVKERFWEDRYILEPVHPRIYYAADGPCPRGDQVVRSRPSIYMPRWASRITLEIVKVRVERLQDISEKDAKAEGLHRNPRGL